MDGDRPRSARALTSLRTALLGALAFPSFALAAQALAIADVSVVDVEHGRLIGPRTVLIADGRITAVGVPSDLPIPRGTERVDGRGRFLMPGLVDMHVHLFNNASHRPPNTWSLPLYVANGVTSVREMAALPESLPTVDGWRRAAASGTLVAPRIVAVGVVAWGPSPEAAAHQVDLAADARADFIKVFSEIGEPAWRSALDAAKRRGLPLMGHVPAGVSAVTAAQEGQKSEEHLLQLFEACSTIEQDTLAARRNLAGDALAARRDADEPRVLAAFDAQRCDAAAAQLAATGVAQVPTLVLDDTESRPHDPHPERDPRWKQLRADEQARWLRILRDQPIDAAASAAQRRDVARRIMQSLHRAGATILAGTDAPMPGVYPGDALHEEIELLVAAGLTPAEALRAATLEPARFLGLSADSGSVEAGKRADLVLLDADPLSDIRNTRRIAAVFVDGRLLRRDALDALLAEAPPPANPKD